MTSVEEYYQQMMEDFTARTGVAVADSCDLAARMYALAAQVYALRAQSDWVRRQCFPQTASGENLDHHAQLRCLERKQATRSTGVVRFTAGESSELVRTVPVGTVCMTAGLVRFQTTRAGVLEAGEMWVDVPVRAVEPGAAGNAAAGTITRMAVAPVGIVSCTNPEACAGGVDQEDDESLRARVLDTFRSLPNGANAAFYRQLAMADDEVAAAVVVSRPRGVGSVDVVVASQTGAPGDELLQRLQESLNEQREIAVDLQVRSPETVEVSLEIQVAPREGLEAETVLYRVRSAIYAYFTGALLGRDVLLAKLGSLVYGCEGVENYRILSPGADVAVEDTQLPVLAGLKVEVMA